MARRGALSFLTLALVACLLLVQPVHAAGDEDWFSKVVGKVSGFLKQDPNEKENYSAAKETAEQMQDVKNRRKELGIDTWQGAFAEYYSRGSLQVEKYLGSSRKLLASLVKIYAPQQVVDFISRMHGAPGAAVDVAADAASSAAAAAASVGRSAAEAVAGSTGATFDDLHNQAQKSADALIRAAKKKAEEVAGDVADAVHDRTEL
mmetsp:Transcript_1004/g.3060  ORF Transcript_1004/g.3060 Transcript_1004/m.3060 type:complete len:205 (-) Transcript_1004:930-1544(-)|eukprot:CAMPEP_0206138338 /NCGR_PEP_ID=MMETSP1473-20131121/3246_1 /ASSEMBLY_ACC=CAM_ASM_001109 /TAXON_ID=1461547 /ORGANISM="Stichococcus sp, Strain RCC1054" /LENGTH=204 /DNA_ID=CAMNT_0053531737 /DNA_START=204 /DNA_END=818 /DNA_ORIENTATION=+